MLIPEIALVTSALSLLIALISCLLILVSRRQMNVKMEDLRFELQVHMSANHEMAKHLRALQKTSNAMSKKQRTHESVADLDDFDYRDHLRSEDSMEESRFATQSPKRKVKSLAEKLGLSESEADIMSHLRPRSQRVQETI